VTGSTNSLPIDEILPGLIQTLEEPGCVLLHAPPGAGKTTRVPLALLECGWVEPRRILMLEPRRLAARSAARYMARTLGEEPGGTVGYRTRLDSRVSDRTRIEVVTEGIVTRVIQSDPEMGDYACVIFDEYHERSLQADLGLALVRESQQALRPDLRVIVMSATLDVAPLAKLLDDAPVLSSPGRSFPVEVFYTPPGRHKRLLEHAAGVICRVLDEEPGSVLVFLPGVGEIRRTVGLLEGRLPPDTLLAPLYGALSPAEQDRAIAPPEKGTRKVVLATAIAETSLTIEGVRIVVDAGLERRASFDPNSGMTRLITGPVSRAAAEQRRGRAGRIEPGICHRLWPESAHKRLEAFATPEILQADLAPLVLELAQWGCRDPATLDWLDPPNPAYWNQAVELLQWLDALDENGTITAHGRAMLKPGLHPRLAHMLVRARKLDRADLAAELAALLSERDLLGREAGMDLEARVRHLRASGGRGRAGQVLKAARRMDKKAGSGKTPASDSGRLLAFAWPDRIARRRPGNQPRFLLSNGRGAISTEDDALGGQEWLVAADLDGQAREARIYLAASVDQDWLETQLADHVREVTESTWDDKRGRVITRRQHRLGALVLEDRPGPEPGREEIEQALLAAVTDRGLDSLPWTESARQHVARVDFLHRLFPEQWPDSSDEALAESLDQWLAPFLAGMTRWSDIRNMNLLAALESRLDHEQRRRLDELAPKRIKVPAGQMMTLDYRVENPPVLAVKLQAIFGWTRTPTVAGGKAPVTLHLLSPAGRPLAVTADLASFWNQAYPEVRKDMRGRYPKHPWPEDPLTASPTFATRKKS